MPQAVSGLSRDSASNEGSIVVDWSPSTGDATGGATIDSYNIQYSAHNANSWTDLQGEDGSFDTSLTATFTVPGPQAGNEFDFQVRAHNVHGWGPFSSIFTIKAADKPEATTAPTTAVVNQDVTITWAAPTDDNSDAVTGYHVYIKDSSSSYQEETEHCDGTTDPVFSARSCAVPMAKLAGTYGLAADTLVEVTVTSENSIGESAASPPSTGAAEV